MLFPKFRVLCSDDSQPNGPFGTELFKCHYRLAIVLRERHHVYSCWGGRGEKPAAPLAIIENDRVAKDGCHRDHEVTGLAYLSQGQSQFIAWLVIRRIHSPQLYRSQPTNSN